MADIEWGREIAVNGKRPAWLADDVQICPIGRSGKEYGPYAAGDTPCSEIYYHQMHAIRLPADHFAYKALDAGFEPWGGGDAAPDDWDGGEVFMAEGYILSVDHGVSSWQRREKAANVIGYRKRAWAPHRDYSGEPMPEGVHRDPPALAIGLRRVERIETLTLTESEAAQVLRDAFGLPVGALVVFNSDGHGAVQITTATVEETL